MASRPLDLSGSDPLFTIITGLQSVVYHGANPATTDLVFDGARPQPYVESDAPAPLNVYGRTKAEAEARVLSAYPQALVVRTSAFFGPRDECNYVTLALRAESTLGAASERLSMDAGRGRG